MTEREEVVAAALEAATEDLELVREQLLLVEAELEGCQTRCVELFEQSPVALLVLDRRGRVLQANDAAHVLLDRSLAPLVGRPFSALFAGGDGRRMGVIASAAEGGARDGRLVGAEVEVRVFYRVRRDERVDCAVVDVSELHRAQSEMREGQARWRTLIDAAPSALLDTDVRGRIEIANRAAVDLFESEAEWLLGAEVVDLIQCVPLRDFFVRELPAPQAGCAGIARTKTGRTVPVEVVVRAYLHGGEPRCVIVVRDVQERQRLQREVLEMREADRRRLGRDLHDGLGQQVAGLSMLVRTLETRVAGGDAETGRLASRASSIANDLAVQVRALARTMYPLELESKGLVPALRALASQVEESSGLRIQLRLSEKAPIEVDVETASQLFRLVQEALSNAVRHSGAQSVLVRVHCDAERLEVAVIDDGCGLPPPDERRDGMGLRLMEERAALVGGYLAVGPPKTGGRGTTVRCTLPRRPAGKAKGR